eukprot:m.172497 g.172497  ORF g.172497 m.172497 type:complete len:608 (-) comp31688_c0_seq2:238-2061(-)
MKEVAVNKEMDERADWLRMLGALFHKKMELPSVITCMVCDVEKNADCFSGNVRKKHLTHLINGTVPSSRCKECTKVYILQNEAIQSKPKHTTLDEVLPIEFHAKANCLHGLRLATSGVIKSGKKAKGYSEAAPSKSKNDKLDILDILNQDLNLNVITVGLQVPRNVIKELVEQYGGQLCGNLNSHTNRVLLGESMSEDFLELIETKGDQILGCYNWEEFLVWMQTLPCVFIVEPPPQKAIVKELYPWQDEHRFFRSCTSCGVQDAQHMCGKCKRVSYCNTVCQTVDRRHDCIPLKVRLHDLVDTTFNGLEGFKIKEIAETSRVMVQLNDGRVKCFKSDNLIDITEETSVGSLGSPSGSSIGSPTDSPMDSPIGSPQHSPIGSPHHSPLCARRDFPAEYATNVKDDTPTTNDGGDVNNTIKYSNPTTADTTTTCLIVPHGPVISANLQTSSNGATVLGKYHSESCNTCAWDLDPIVDGLGVKYKLYTWRQNLSVVELRVLLPTETKRTDLSVVITSNHVKVQIKSEQPIIDHHLSGKVYIGDDSDTMWYMSKESGHQCARIQMTKAKSRIIQSSATEFSDSWWKTMFLDASETEFAYNNPPAQYYDTR